MRHFSFFIKPYLLFFLFFLCIPNSSQAQTPPDSLSGEDLRVWFKTNWFDGLHTTLGYDGVNGARSYMYNIIDNHDDTITCVYSGHKEYRIYDLTRAAGALGMTPINCEHSIPQSFFNYLEPMKSDIHHLYPTYQSWNSTRSNHPFADIVDTDTEKWMHLTSSQISIPAADIDWFSEFKSGFFEPREDHKGNLSRAIFYFYTMYPTEAGGMNLLGDVNTFYQWHLSDTEDAFEYQRDDDIFTYQGNANPYLTNPGWITRVFDLGNLPPPELALSASASSITISWGDMPTEIGYKVYRSTDNINYTQIGTTLNADTVIFVDNTAIQSTTYYYHVVGEYSGGNSLASSSVNGMLLPAVPPSAVTDLVLTIGANSLDLSWTDVLAEDTYQLYRSIDNVNFNILGSALSANTISYSDNSAIAGTTYYYYIVAGNIFGNSSNSNTVNGQIPTIPTAASDLIISEYVEGSSYNKSLEIANFTGASVDLSDYTLRKQTNGSGSWISFTLSGTLANQTTYVVVNNSAGATLKGKADLLTTSSVFSFNGNDPVALFKNSSIIDIVGVENAGSTNNFATDVTMVRNADITDPNLTYFLSEWTVKPKDDFTNVGVHTMTLSGILPVELVEFSGRIFPEFNRLEWKTASERNSAYFEIESSLDGIDFKTIGKVNAIGNSNQTRRYEFVENKPSQISYYRLKQVDLDDAFEYSEVLYLSRIIKEPNLSLSPNPANKFIYLDIEMPNDGQVEIVIYSMTGQLVFRNEMNLEKGIHYKEINLQRYEQGVYFVEMKNKNQITQKKFVKVGR